MTDYRPQDHVAAPTMRTGYRHPSAMKLANVVKNGSASIAVGIAGSGIVTAAAEGLSSLALGGTFWALPSLLVGTVALTGLTYVRSMHVSAVDKDKEAMQDLQNKATQALNVVLFETRNPQALMTPADVRSDDEKLRHALDAADLQADFNSIVESKDPRLADLRRITIIRLAAMNVAYVQSLAIMGSAPKGDLLAVMCDGLRRALSESVARREAIVGYARPSSEGGPTIVDTFRESMSQALAIGTADQQADRDRTGTGHARFDRLIAKGEEALSLDPNMVDAAGARLDAAFREHLPRLLKTHAESARHAKLEDLEETDRQLETGIEQIRSSLEEGLQTLRHEKADALRTEVAFLKLRRAGVDGPLRAIERDRAA